MAWNRIIRKFYLHYIFIEITIEIKLKPHCFPQIRCEMKKAFLNMRENEAQYMTKS